MLISQQKKNYGYFQGLGCHNSIYFDSPNQVNFDSGEGQRHPKRVFDAPQYYRLDGQDWTLYRNMRNTPYTDTKGDGYGDSSRPILTCEAPDYNMMNKL